MNDSSELELLYKKVEDCEKLKNKLQAVVNKLVITIENEKDLTLDKSVSRIVKIAGIFEQLHQLELEVLKVRTLAYNLLR